MIDALSYTFFQRALVAGIIAGALCGLLSVFIIAKKMAFIGQGISHAAFGGVALGLFLGINPLPTATLFAVAMALGVAALSKSGYLHRDAIIGIIMALGMAIGVVLLSFTRSYAGTVTSYLFGNILAVGRTELHFLIAVAILCFGYIFLFYKELEFFVFDEHMARRSGIPVDRIQQGLLVCIALTVIASIQVAGIILITALLVVPGVVAVLIGRRFGSLFPISIATGVVASIIGLFISYALNIPSGASIVFVLTILFAIAMVFKRLAKRGR